MCINIDKNIDIYIPYFYVFLDSIFLSILDYNLPLLLYFYVFLDHMYRYIHMVKGKNNDSTLFDKFETTVTFVSLSGVLPFGFLRSD